MISLRSYMPSKWARWDRISASLLDSTMCRALPSRLAWGSIVHPAGEPPSRFRCSKNSSECPDQCGNNMPATRGRTGQERKASAANRSVSSEGQPGFSARRAKACQSSLQGTLMIGEAVSQSFSTLRSQPDQAYPAVCGVHASPHQLLLLQSVNDSGDITDVAPELLSDPVHWLAIGFRQAGKHADLAFSRLRGFLTLPRSPSGSARSIMWRMWFEL